MRRAGSRTGTGPPPFAEVTAVRNGVVVRAPRIVDDRVADRLVGVAADVRRAARGRAVTHLDLRGVTWCSRSALEAVGSLLEAGVRLVVEPVTFEADCSEHHGCDRRRQPA